MTKLFSSVVLGNTQFFSDNTKLLLCTYNMFRMPCYILKFLDSLNRSSAISGQSQCLVCFSLLTSISLISKHQQILNGKCVCQWTITIYCIGKGGFKGLQRKIVHFYMKNSNTTIVKECVSEAHPQNIINTLCEYLEQKFSTCNKLQCL